MDRRIIAVEHDTLDEVCRQITLHVSAIDDELDRLEAAAAALSGQWSGEARDAYHVAQRGWDQTMREMTAIARQLSAVARQGNDRFRRQDAREASVWAR
ncbi:WXG100 family type VII secretion target [Microbacterium sp.]|uniref:WXG100 family type VII secretion target n=1 Tax=Microbacterium sp. TaxID=51671 RepID=UPI0039E7083E